MIVVTQELKDTLKDCPHVEAVHFNSLGHHFFQAHSHVDKDGKTSLYSRFTKRNTRLSSDREDAPTKETITAREEDRITDTVPASDILSRPVDVTLTSDQAKAVSDENTSLRKQIEELKARQSENEVLKAQLDALKTDTVGTTEGSDVATEDKRPVEKVNRK
jgi:hypothetical protein